MHIPTLSLCVLLSTVCLSAQVGTTAQLVGGAVLANASSAAPIVPGSDVWPGLSRTAGGTPNGASLWLQHQQSDAEVVLQWQLESRAIVTGSSSSRAEVRYQLVSPQLQTGELVIEWLPSTIDTGQTSLSIDVYDDGYIDTVGNATIPVAFQQFPLTVRVVAEVSAQAGTLQGPWGSSWSWNGSAAAQLRIRFVPTQASVTTAVSQLCQPAPVLTGSSDLNQGVLFTGQCAPADDFALFAFGFAPAQVPLPWSPACSLLVDPVLTLLHPVAAGQPCHQATVVPAAVRPAQFLTQLVALNTTTMTLTASDLLRAEVH